MRLKVISLCSILVFIISICYPQTAIVTISGMVKGKAALSTLPFVNVLLKKEKDSAFVTGTVTNEEGRFTLSNIPPGNYILQFSYAGFALKSQPVLVGSLRDRKSTRLNSSHSDLSRMPSSA